MRGGEPHPRSDSAESAETARRITRRWPLVSGGIGILLVAALGALIALREGNLPFSFDTAFLGELVEHRSAFWTVPALVMNNVGAGLIGVIVILYLLQYFPALALGPVVEHFLMLAGKTF